MSNIEFEKQGVFYLGRRHDLSSGVTSNENLLYKSKDLTTHAMVVGMTGSGKTGLCLGLLEEAGMDGIPAIIIDPKGDIGNLLLTFPEMRPSDFRPWVDEVEATRKGLNPDQFAKLEAEKWQQGLESWGQDLERIKRFRQKVNLCVFTPGSKQGRPISILRGFEVPSQEVLDDREAFGDYVSTTASGLLGLLKIDSDPATSQPHILLSKILNDQWKAKRSLHLDELVKLVLNPPFKQVGVLDLDRFLPEKERTTLAMAINNLIASPALDDWRTGEPLNIQNLLYDKQGKANISILSISHLDDSERMFFVTMLLNELVAWTRKQSGTSSLRAIFYMDEVFGYFPPVANPPSKRPMLTLLKQARAFGIGVLLATQNPVDLDYKGLSNMGTWFLGRLQTERDRMRVLEGLEGVSGASESNFSTGEIGVVLAGLGARKFLMNNVHEDGQQIFETRWAMSYLRGPIATSQIKQLNSLWGCPYEEYQKDEVTRKVGVVLPAGVREKFVQAKRTPVGSSVAYLPALIGIGEGKYKNPKQSQTIDAEIRRVVLLSDVVSSGDWEKSFVVGELEFSDQVPGSQKLSLPVEASDHKNLKHWQDSLEVQIRTEAKQVLWCAEAKQGSEFLDRADAKQAFQSAVLKSIQESREAKLNEERKKVEAKLVKAKGKLTKAESQVSQRWWDTISYWGQTIVAFVLALASGRKTASVANVNKVGTAVRKGSKIAAEKEDVKIAQDAVQLVEAELNDKDAEIKGVQELKAEDLQFEELSVQPTAVSVKEFSEVAWLPYLVDSGLLTGPWFEIKAKE